VLPSVARVSAAKTKTVLLAARRAVIVVPVERVLSFDDVVVCCVWRLLEFPFVTSISWVWRGQVSFKLDGPDLIAAIDCDCGLRESDESGAIVSNGLSQPLCMSCDDGKPSGSKFSSSNALEGS